MDGETSRHRLFEAAASEFAAKGFAGASVDRIAAAARLNKAMIYYHFKSKAHLYREILRDMFSAVERRVADTAASAVTPEDKVRGFVAAIAAEAEARPHFPPIWFREIADGGAHLDGPTVRHIAGVVKTLAGNMWPKALLPDGSVRSTRSSSRRQSWPPSSCISRAAGCACASIVSA
jgi:AcrR family transcriptional regulator